jgi:hypothetical protein
LLSLFGGRSQPVVAHLIESGKLTMEDIREAERMLRGLFSCWLLRRMAFKTAATWQVR